MLPLPILTRQDALQRTNEKIRNVEEFASKGLRTQCHVTQRMAQAVLLHSIQAMMTMLEGDQFSTIFFYRGPGVSPLRLLSFYSTYGRLYYAAKEKVKKEDIPLGPIGLVQDYSVGQVGDIQLRAGMANDVTLLPDPAVSNIKRRIVPTDAASSFGIKDVTRDLTLDQFDATTFKADCPLVITGPPGVGKTTVAMERLGWLLQLEIDPSRDEDRKAIQAKYGKDFQFSADTVHVLVRRQHLQSHLASYAQNQGIPPSVVVELSNFLMKLSRNLAGAKKLRFRPTEEDRWCAIKEMVSWEDIVGYVATVHNERNVITQSDRRFVGEVVEELRRIADNPFVSAGASGVLRGLVERIGALLVDFEADGATVFEQILDALDSTITEDLLKKELGGERTNVREKRREWRAKLRSRLSRLFKSGLDVISLLYKFYQAEEFLEKARKFHVDEDEWSTFVEACQKERAVFPADHLVLAALREAVLEIAPTNDQFIFRASHIVIDEAQLMPPLLLRLISERWCGRLGSCTMVGDPQQTVSRTSDTDYFMRLPNVQAIRLNEVHRVSRQQFDFLRALAPVIGINDELKPGRNIAEGPLPFLSDEAEDFDDELDAAVNILESWYTKDPRAKIVMVPCPSPENGEMKAMAELLESLAKDRGIPLVDKLEGRFDVNEQEPTLAHIDSLIGLEFDYVLLFNTAHYCKPEYSSEHSGAIWIAASRPRKQFAAVLRKSEARSIFRNAELLSLVASNIDLDTLLGEL